MTDFLVFTLDARMASFGGPAGHERRGSETWPGRSALMGLLGAALGVRRDDEEGQRELANLSFAVAAYDIGSPIRDYHTVQTVDRKVKAPRTRAAAISEAKLIGALNTSITFRDYRCGVFYGVAAWSEKIDLTRLQDALARPVFTLYLGRKSCPLSMPVAAQIVASKSPVAALEAIRIPEWRKDSFTSESWKFIASDPHPELPAQSTEWRYDEPLDRLKWHFGVREVKVLRRARS